jgi:hypothetical protein
MGELRLTVNPKDQGIIAKVKTCGECGVFPFCRNLPANHALNGPVSRTSIFNADEMGIRKKLYQGDAIKEESWVKPCFKSQRTCQYPCSNFYTLSEEVYSCAQMPNSVVAKGAACSYSKPAAQLELF